MPYKEKISGIYSITTPNGSVYIGSSKNIRRRWCEHKSTLRHQKHKSSRLQDAWNKHGGNLIFEIIEVCDQNVMEQREQFYIKKLNAKLNTTQYVGNVWCNPETREKFKIIHSSPEWRAARSAIAKNVAKKRGVHVDCSDGRTFDNFHRAAEAFGVTPARIKYLVQTQRVGNIGVKFKKHNEEWRDVLSVPEQRMQTMIKNGTLVRKKKNRICDVPGCGNIHKGHGLCCKHLRQKRNGVHK